MEPTMILAAAKLLWEIYKEIERLVSKAEYNEQLDSQQKHKHVEQQICKIIDGKKFCLQERDMLKDYIKKEKLIEQQVELEHEKGHFIRS